MTSFLDRLTDAACVVIDWLVYLGVWCFWLGVLVLALLGVVARAADVSPEPPGPAIIPGVRYRMNWGGMVYDVVFRRGGAYECFAAGGTSPCYLGSWTVRGGVLAVSERTTDQRPGCKWAWTSNEASTINGNRSAIKLRRLK